MGDIVTDILVTVVGWESCKEIVVVEEVSFRGDVVSKILALLLELQGKLVLISRLLKWSGS